MAQPPRTTRRTARLARAALVALCAVLAVGAGSSVTARLVDPGQAPADDALDATDSTTPETSPDPMEQLPVGALLLDSAETPAAPRTRVIQMEVTAYCPCEKCCGTHSPGITASGKKVTYNRGRFVAADTRLLPFGTRLSIPGYHDGRAVPVLDRGGAIKGHKLDVYFPSHQTALEWGRRKIPVTVIED